MILKYIRSIFPKDETDSIKNLTVSYEYSLINKQVLSEITSVPNVSYERKKVKIYPNPFRDNISIQIDLKSPGKVNMIIYDVSGKQVDKINTEYLNSGRNTIKWDAVKRNGKPCKRGVYICKVTSPDGTISEKLIRID